MKAISSFIQYLLSGFYLVVIVVVAGVIGMNNFKKVSDSMEVVYQQ